MDLLALLPARVDFGGDPCHNPSNIKAKPMRLSLLPAHPMRWVATRFAAYAAFGIIGMAIITGLALLPNSPILKLLDPPEEPQS